MYDKIHEEKFYSLKLMSAPKIFENLVSFNEIF